MDRIKKRILYVDDDEDSCDLMNTLLGMLGYEVIQAQVIAQAVAKASSDGLDLCLVDNWLPDGSGIDLCRQIRSFNPHIPIVFYSGVACDSDKEAAIRAGAQAYLVKPTGMDVIEETISRRLGNTDGRDGKPSQLPANGHKLIPEIIKEAERQWTESSKSRIERSRELAKAARERINRSALKIEQTLSRYDQKKY